MRKMTLYAAAAALLALVLTACAPAITRPAAEYSATVVDATNAATTALGQLQADGYGPYVVGQADVSTGSVTASLVRESSTLNLSVVVVPIVGGVRVSISGTSSDPAAASDTASAIVHVYELLAAALPAM